MTGHRQRPDPDEPWRYACPGCGSDRLYAITSSRREPGYTARWDGRGAEELREQRAEKYACRGCGERHDRVVDRATGEATPATPRP